MSNLHVGARAPWAVPFVLATGAIDGTDVARVLVRIVLPSGATIDIDGAPSVATLSSVTALWSLAADGSSVVEDGIAQWRAYLYDSGDALLGWTKPAQLTIDPNPVPFPT